MILQKKIRQRFSMRLFYRQKSLKRFIEYDIFFTFPNKPFIGTLILATSLATVKYITRKKLNHKTQFHLHHRFFNRNTIIIKKTSINPSNTTNENRNNPKTSKTPNKGPVAKHDPQSRSFTGPEVVAAPVHVNVTGAHASPIPGGAPAACAPRLVCKIDSGPRRAPPAPAPPGPPPGSTTWGARVTLERGAAPGLLINRWVRSIFWIYWFLRVGFFDVFLIVVGRFGVN